MVTTLDHDANVAPWSALEEKGVVIRQVDIRDEDCTLDLDDLKSKLNEKTKLVAVGYASNAVGTINPVAEITHLAHAAGALIFIDAVHYAPHGPIDVKALDCDFLVCSPYKFFGPHMGTLYGKREHLQRFRPYKVRPGTDQVPDRWESGTQIHELIAGICAAVDYSQPRPPLRSSRQHAARCSASRLPHNVAARTHALISRLSKACWPFPVCKFFGITDPNAFTIAARPSQSASPITRPPKSPPSLANAASSPGTATYYALNLTERLGVESNGGLLRIGLVHYNTAEEVDRLLSRR